MAWNGVCMSNMSSMGLSIEAGFLDLVCKAGSIRSAGLGWPDQNTIGTIAKRAVTTYV